MVRKARIKSETGIYHVLVRTTADLRFFSDEEDYKVYIDRINELQQKGYGEVYAYALFPTHVHLLLKDASSKESKESVGTFMKRISATFSFFYNAKYNHYGPIYLDRFKSNPVETREYFLKVLDHIENQKTKYKITCQNIPSGLSESSRAETEGPLLDYKERRMRITDSRLLKFLSEKFNFVNAEEFTHRTREEQDTIIRESKEKGGSIRQIVRLTGATHSHVFSVKHSQLCLMFARYVYARVYILGCKGR